MKVKSPFMLALIHLSGTLTYPAFTAVYVSLRALNVADLLTLALMLLSGTLSYAAFALAVLGESLE